MPEVVHVTNSIIIVNVGHLSLLGCYVTLTSEYIPTVQRNIIFTKIFISTILKFFYTYILRFYAQLGHNHNHTITGQDITNPKIFIQLYINFVLYKFLKPVPVAARSKA